MLTEWELLFCSERGKVMRTIKDHAQNAKCLMSYIPVNVSGVVFSFAEWMQLCCDLKMSQEERNNHPITKGYLIGLQSMFQIDLDYSETIDQIDSIIDSKEIEGL